MRKRSLKSATLGILITLALVTACQPVGENTLYIPGINNITDSSVETKTTIKGRVDFTTNSPQPYLNIREGANIGVDSSSPSFPSPVTGHPPLSSPFTTFATSADIGSNATVSLIYPPGHSTYPNVTQATGLSDVYGNFKINSSDSFVPTINDVFILEATRRIGSSGNHLMSLRTYIKWNGNGWDSITYSTNPADAGLIFINSKTTALTIIDSYDSAITPTQTIQSINVTTGSSVPNDIIGGSTVTGQKVLDVAVMVSYLLEQNVDPDKFIGFANNAYYINKESNHALIALDAGFDCPNCNLKKENLNNKNYQNRNLSYTDLSGSNLTGTVLQGANLSNANLTDANLNSANLTGANLTGTNFTGATWTNGVICASGSIGFCAPFPPGVLTSTGINSTSFTANWNAVSFVTGYKLFVNGIQYPDVNTIISTASYNVTGLTAGSSPSYYVKSVNSTVTGAASSTSNVLLIPPAPVSQSATNGNQTSFTANWNTASGATGFKLYVNGSQYPDNTTVIGINSYNVTGLSKLTTYNYNVLALNSSGESTSSNTILFSNALVSTLAGGTYGYTDATGTNAQFQSPNAITVDSSGNVYVGEGNTRIRKITPAGIVTTLAGSSPAGFADGTGTNAKFYDIHGLAVDSAGNVYVTDAGNRRIRKIGSTGVVTTFAGNGDYGVVDGTGTNASVNSPDGIAVDSAGNVYFADSNRIRKITPGGVVTTIAGSTFGFNDATGTNAQFYAPKQIAVDSGGNLYIADSSNYKIRKMTPSWVVTTIAGNGTPAYTDGTGTNAQFLYPQGVAVDSSGNVYVADNGTRIRKINTSGVVTTIAGNGTSGFADGIGTNTQFSDTRQVAVDSAGNVYAAEFGNYRIRKIE